MVDQFMTTVNDNQVPYTADRHPNRIKDKCYKFFMVTVVTLFAGLFIYNYLKLIFVPTVPEIHHVSVETLTLTNFNRSLNSLSPGNWETRIIVQIPDSKYPLYYDNIKVDLRYKSDVITSTNVPPFVQGIKINDGLVNATFGSFNANLGDWGGINGDLRDFRMVNFDVNMNARVRFEKRHWWDKLGPSHIKFKAYCPNLLVSEFANRNGGSLFGGSKQCKFSYPSLL